MAKAQPSAAALIWFGIALALPTCHDRPLRWDCHRLPTTAPTASATTTTPTSPIDDLRPHQLAGRRYRDRPARVHVHRVMMSRREQSQRLSCKARVGPTHAVARDRRSTALRKAVDHPDAERLGSIYAPLMTTYRVVEAGATEPEDLERWLIDEASQGWRCVSVTSMPANSVRVKVGGTFFNPEREELRGYRMDGLGSDTVSRTVVYNVWVTLERTAT